MTGREEWRPVSRWEGLYEVSDRGRVKSLGGTYRARRKGKWTEVRKPERILRQYLTAGYPAVALCRDGMQTTTYVHRLVCEAWHGPNASDDVAHADGVRTNNTPDNVRWATRAENMADKVLHGTQKRGDDLWFTKVPDAQVLEIRRDTSMSSAEWAAQLGVSRSLIDGIRAGTNRKTVGVR